MPHHVHWDGERLVGLIIFAVLGLLVFASMSADPPPPEPTEEKEFPALLCVSLVFVPAIVVFVPITWSFRSVIRTYFKHGSPAASAHLRLRGVRSSFAQFNSQERQLVDALASASMLSVSDADRMRKHLSSRVRWLEESRDRAVRGVKNIHDKDKETAMSMMAKGTEPEKLSRTISVINDMITECEEMIPDMTSRLEKCRNDVDALRAEPEGPTPD